MDNNHFIIVVILLVVGFSNVHGQVDDLSCENFCLSVGTTCTCTVTGLTLTWALITTNGDAFGRIVDSGDLGTPTTIPGFPLFDVLLTDSSSGTLTATLSFTTLSQYQGYVIECDTANADASTVTINIPGPPLSATDLELSAFTTGSVILTFTAPANSSCVASYTITTTASAPSSTTATSVMITKPGGDPPDTTYNVCVAAVDTGGRTGPSASIDCFIFSGPDAVTVSNGPNFGMLNDVCVAQFEWTSEICLPEIISVNVTVNSTTTEVVTEGVVAPTSMFILSDISAEEVYSVTIVPSNTLGLGSPTSTIITVPSICPTTMMNLPSSSIATTVPEPTNKGQLSTLAIAVIVVGILAVVLLIIVVILVVAIVLVVKNKNDIPPQSPTGTLLMSNKYFTGQQNCQGKAKEVPVYDEVGVADHSYRTGNEPMGLTINAAYGRI